VVSHYRSWAEVNTENIRHNVEVIHNRVKKGIFAVVKADAYGHGAVEISKVLEKLPQIEYLCVATAEEGKELREAGIKKGILVLGGLLPEEKKYFTEYNLIPVISDYNQLKLVKNLPIRKIHLKFDTGMHRLGFPPEEVDNLLRKLDGIQVEGVMSHFPSADTDRQLTENQIKQFKGIVDRLKHLKPKYIHLQNSAGLMYNCDYCNAVRIGISIYGEKPSPQFNIPVKMVMGVKAKLITVKKLKKGERVSYNGTFQANRDMVVGVVAFGYADGLPRELSNRGYFKINGKKAPILGNITMDMTVVDLSEVGNVSPSQEVVVVGDGITFSQIASLSNTIPYEIMCRISKRVKRIPV